MRIGFDLGGTKMLAAAVSDDNTIIAKSKRATKTGTNDDVLNDIAATIQEVLAQLPEEERRAVRSLGIAVPGPIDLKRGILLDTPNIGVHDFPLVDLLKETVDFPVYLENDVNAGLWGEFVAGAARGLQHVVGVFPGTGIGGGLILDGRLYRGKRGSAGEVGHVVIQSDGRKCGCGGMGCFETVASKTAIARDLVMLAANGRAPTVLEVGGTDITRIKSKLILKAYRRDGADVRDVVNQAADFLGICMANLVNIFDPEAIIIGGGLVEKLGTPYLDRATEMMRKRAMPRLVEDVLVRSAELGDGAAVIGAADLAERHLEEDSAQ